MEKIIAAGVLPICITTKRILLSKRHAHVMYGSTWASWGGKFEEELGDRTAQDCAKREFWEETRIEHPYIFTEEPVHIYVDERVVYYTFIGFFDREVEANIAVEGGLAEAQWFPLDALPEPLMPEFKIMMDAEMEKLKSMTDMMNGMSVVHVPLAQTIELENGK